MKVRQIGGGKLPPSSSKHCTRCGELKEFGEFYNTHQHVNGKTYYGKASYCKACIRIIREWQYSKGLDWNRNNPERRRENFRRYNQSPRRRAWRQEYRLKNKERMAANLRRWRATDPDWKAKQNIYQQKRREDLQIRLSTKFSNSIYKSIRRAKNGYLWESLVGYTLADLRAHLEAQFVQGMTWDNYGTWHIDHKIPISWWQFRNPEDSEFKQCWALCNLQPMWAEENMKKSNRRAA